LAQQLLVLRDFLFVSQQTSIFHTMPKRSALAMVQVVLLWDAASISGAVKSTATIQQAEIEAFEVSPQASFKAHKDENFEDGAQAGKLKSIKLEDCHICCEQPPVFAQAQWLRNDKKNGRSQTLICKRRQGAPSNKCGSAGRKLCKKAPCQLIVDQEQANNTKKGCNFEQFIEDECTDICNDEPPLTIEDIKLSADMYAAMSRGDEENATKFHKQLMQKVREKAAELQHKLQKVQNELQETYAKQMEKAVEHMEQAMKNHNKAAKIFNNASANLMKIQAAEKQAEEDTDEEDTDEEDTGNFITRFIGTVLWGVQSPQDRAFVKSELADAHDKAEADVKEARENAEKAEEFLRGALKALKTQQARQTHQDPYGETVVQKFVDKQKKLCRESCNARFGQIPFFSPTSFRDLFQEVPPPRSST